jgi:hypothetical protein
MEVQNRQKMNTGGQKQRDRWKSHNQTPLWLSILRKLAALWTLSTHTHTHKSIATDGRTCSSSSSWPLCDEALDIVRRTSGKAPKRKEKQNDKVDGMMMTRGAKKHQSIIGALMKALEQLIKGNSV